LSRDWRKRVYGKGRDIFQESLETWLAPLWDSFSKHYFRMTARRPDYRCPERTDGVVFRFHFVFLIPNALMYNF
jgi:hypothetical protein